MAYGSLISVIFSGFHCVYAGFMEFKDYYQVLGVERKATSKEIKAAYRGLARKFHPDLHPGDHEAEKRFSDINEAYEVLSDQEKRREFDEIADYVAVQGHPPEARYESDGDAASFFEQFFGRRHSRAATRPGPDQHMEVEISLREACFGTTRQLRMDRQELCPRCQGSGMHERKLCPVCRGMGQTATPQSVEIKIPSGVTEGSVVRMAGLGGPGSPRGDLVLVVTLAPDPVYRVEGYDLHRDVDVSIFSAILGGEVEVEGMKGKLGLKLPAETQNGKVFRLRGQGLVRPTGQTPGDLYVQIFLRIPTGLTPQVRNQFRLLQQQVEGGESNADRG